MTRLCRQHADKRAAREYLKILQLAARESESAVQDALRAALGRGEEISFAAVQAAVQSSQQVPAVTEVQVEAPDLRVFDTLLDHSYMEVERHEFSVGQEVFVPVLTEQAVAAIACAADIAAGVRCVAGAAGVTAADAGSNEELKEQFRELRLPMFREHFQKLADQAARESLSHPQYLAELTRLECQTRRERRIQRLLEQSRLPRAKSWESFDWKRIPLPVARQAESLKDGSFLDRRENLLVFGKPGSGKTHCVCALAGQLVEQGRAMLFTTCGLLVQSLLAAKRDLRG